MRGLGGGGGRWGSGQTLIKVVPNKVKWVVKFVQKTEASNFSKILLTLLKGFTQIF